MGVGNMVILCVSCGWRREVDVGDLPAERIALCPKCRGNDWTPADEPTRRYELSSQDRRFLRSLRIRPDKEDWAVV